MVYVDKILLNNIPTTKYPFSVNAVLNISDIKFEKPITILSGSNGCGKTTIMEIIAEKLSAIRIGEALYKSQKSSTIAKYHNAFKLSTHSRAKRNFYFSGEDFIKYIEWVEKTKLEAQEALAEIDLQYEPDSMASNLAKLPHLHTLSDLQSMYGSTLSQESHGEGFIDFFKNRLISQGLYLLDEPEGALSYENQYLLSILVTDAVNHGCQFIISTHSPVISAIPDADILEITKDGITKSTYDDLENIKFLKMFMSHKEVLFKPN